MQPVKRMSKWLLENANSRHYLFTLRDFRPLFTDLSDTAFKTLLSRAVNAKLLNRLCRGLYLYPNALPNDGLLLFHAAARLRAHEFNYISLETALSDAGVISQIPMNWISIMSSGRSNTISCGDFGTIEFVHTNQHPQELIHKITYDQICGMWRASIAQALQDMKNTHRNTDLIDWEVANELI